MDELSPLNSIPENSETQLIQQSIFEPLLSFITCLEITPDKKLFVTMDLPNNLKLDRNEMEKYFYPGSEDIDLRAPSMFMEDRVRGIDRKFKAQMKDPELFRWLTGQCFQKLHDNGIGENGVNANFCYSNFGNLKATLISTGPFKLIE